METIKKIISKIGSRLGIIGGLFKFLWRRKLWWFYPIVIILILFALLMFVTEATPLGAFIYPLF